MGGLESLWNGRMRVIGVAGVANVGTIAVSSKQNRIQRGVRFIFGCRGASKVIWWDRRVSNAGLEGVSTDRADEVRVQLREGQHTLNQQFITYLIWRLRRKVVLFSPDWKSCFSFRCEAKKATRPWQNGNTPIIYSSASPELLYFTFSVWTTARRLTCRCRNRVDGSRVMWETNYVSSIWCTA